MKVLGVLGLVSTLLLAGCACGGRYTSGLFESAVLIAPYAHLPGSLGPFSYELKINLRRSGDYTRYPKDTYEIKVEVPRSVLSPEVMTFTTGEEDSVQIFPIKWQWPAGTIAAKEQRSPNKVLVTVTRKSDGKVEKDEISFSGLCGGGPFG